jgi:hypothetical protein
MQNQVYFNEDDEAYFEALADKLNAARWGELDLQTNEGNQRNEKTNTHKDADDGDYTAIECLFQYLDDPEERLKGFLREDD